MKIPVDNLPDDRQQLLLQAALCSESVGYDSWQKWRKLVDLDTIEEASFRLIPLLYENLKRLHVTELELGKLRGISRYHWCKNQLLLKSMVELLLLLEKNGITTLVLKGGALVYSHYSSPALRPMSDMDIMVPRGQLPGTIELMQEYGWKLRGGIDIYDSGVFNRLHSVELTDGRGNECDLHWTPIWDATWKGAEVHFWETSEPFTLQGVNTRVLGPTEQLFHTIVHGSSYNAMPPIRWIADAVKILAKDSGSIDWEGMLRLGRKYGYLTSLQQGVLYLSGNYPVSIDARVINRYRRLSFPLKELMEYRLEKRYIPAYRIDTLLLRGWLRHCKQKRDSSFTTRVSSFPAYVATRMRIASATDVGVAVKARLKKIGQELKKTKRYWWRPDKRLFCNIDLEIMVSDHCNLTCRACNHFAPVVEPRFQSLDELRKELRILGQAATFRKIKLIGGEPLLHPQIDELAELVKQSGISEKILLVTNGTLLAKISDRLLQTTDEIEISQYPQTCLPKQEIEDFRRHAATLATQVRIFYFPLFQNQFGLKPVQDPLLVNSIFQACKPVHLWGCHGLYKGHLFRCPQSIYLSQIIPQLRETPFADALALADNRGFGRKMHSFFTGRKPLRACSYCLGSVGTMIDHELVKKQNWLAYNQGSVLSMVDKNLLTQPVSNLDPHFTCKRISE